MTSSTPSSEWKTAHLQSRQGQPTRCERCHNLGFGDETPRADPHSSSARKTVHVKYYDLSPGCQFCRLLHDVLTHFVDPVRDIKKHDLFTGGLEIIAEVDFADSSQGVTMLELRFHFSLTLSSGAEHFEELYLAIYSGNQV